MKPEQEEINEIGNQLEQVITEFMTNRKPTNELIIASIAGLSNVLVCAAFAAWGPEFGMECITKAVNAAATKWKESEENEGGEETRVRNQPGS